MPHEVLGLDWGDFVLDATFSERADDLMLKDIGMKDKRPETFKDIMMIILKKIVSM